MLVVKFEVWPDGDARQARQIGEIQIRPEGVAADETGQYDVAVRHCGASVGHPGNFREGKVRGFLREMTVYHLLALALQACGIFPEDAK